ncbi:transmembrane protein -like [Brachionus plicatilis]|uniref:Dolichyl-diphosphooligosaccharide-protein glycosyltransferase subunit TMEM258 n=1 Tax=Brachionus plicatilis TaxID=10195 RepID=A0A3M7QIS3_BRAPC|nr:transmembrane protein -like [Brachionus plicatilis]
MSSFEGMARYVSPINPAVYPKMTFLLMVIGLFFTAWFIVYEVTTNKKTRNLAKEFFMAAIASVFMGSGVFFLLLSVGIYV